MNIKFIQLTDYFNNELIIVSTAHIHYIRTEIGGGTTIMFQSGTIKVKESVVKIQGMIQ